MKNLILIFLTSAILSSCQTIRVHKGNYLYQFEDGQKNGGQHRLQRYKVTDGFDTKFEDKTTYITFDQPVPDAAHLTPIGPPVTLGVGVPAEMYAKYGDKLFFADAESNFLTANRITNTKLKYSNKEFTVTAMSIAWKFRSSLKNDVVKYPSTVTSSFNIGIAPTFKYNINCFTPNKKLLGSHIKRYSLGASLLLGASAVDLDPATNAPLIASKRSAGNISTGWIFLLGFNGISVGYSMGWDHLIGSSKKLWVYRGQMWQGITIGVGIL